MMVLLRDPKMVLMWIQFKKNPTLFNLASMRVENLNGLIVPSNNFTHRIGLERHKGKPPKLRSFTRQIVILNSSCVSFRYKYQVLLTTQ